MCDRCWWRSKKCDNSVIFGPFGLSFGRKTALTSCVTISSSKCCQLEYIEFFCSLFPFIFLLFFIHTNFNVNFFFTQEVDIQMGTSFLRALVWLSKKYIKTTWYIKVTGLTYSEILWKYSVRLHVKRSVYGPSCRPPFPALSVKAPSHAQDARAMPTALCLTAFAQFPELATLDLSLPF